MAAILCGGIGELCKGICNGIGKVICLPCKLCGVATAEVCDIMSSPFCFYLSVAFGLNLPPVVFALQSLQQDGGGGCEKVQQWLLVNAALCIVNIVMAAYISNKVQVEKGSDIEQDGTVYQADFTNTRNNSAARINKIPCHDPLVAVYILVGCALIFWQFEGISRNDHGCNNSSFVSSLLICDFTFIELGGFVFCCSAMCLWRRR